MARRTDSNPTNTFLGARSDILSLTAELCRIYAQDDSESANITAIESSRRAFGAETAALFYKGSKHDFTMCLAGLQMPISIGETRWRDCTGMHRADEMVFSFESWTPPMADLPIRFWISVRLFKAASESGYLFLGRNIPWTELETSNLAHLKEGIAPIIGVRVQRGHEEHRRLEAELALARNEKRLRELFEHSRDMIYTANFGDIITDINHAGVALLGYESKEEIIGKPFSSLMFTPDYRSTFLDSIAHKGYTDDYEIVLVRKDGRSIFCLETANAIRGDSGEFIEIQGIVKDISSRIENERKLWKMNLELAEANLKLQQTQSIMVQHEKLASIGQLAAGVAHELNNPLGFLMSNNNTLKRYFDRLETAWNEVTGAGRELGFDAARVEKLRRAFEDSRSIFEESIEGFERMARIVSSLKNFSRSSSGQEFVDFDLNGGIESTLVVAWNEIKYVSEVRKNLGQIPLIKAIGGEINQVVLNILVNAAQAIGGADEERKGHIDITTRLEGDSVLLSIRDDGPGITPAHLTKIFDPFFTTKEPGKGTGLGLSISYDIITNRHGGRMWAESEPGHGAAFFISLPVSGPPAENA